MTKMLAVVGAGAKAAALVARAEILRKLGVAGVPEIVVFEEKSIGAAWSGEMGLSDGSLRLCTSGEKDVGFPYSEISTSHAFGAIGKPKSSKLLARFSWFSYLIENSLFSEWVDRGRQHPSHGEWAKYLNPSYS